jgi:hypothetical protein
MRVALPAAPLVMATEMTDDRRLPVARVAVKRRTVPRARTAQLVRNDQPFERAMDAGVRERIGPNPWA